MTDDQKLDKIWDVISYYKYLDDIRPRTWHNMINEIAEVIDEDYEQDGMRLKRSD